MKSIFPAFLTSQLQEVPSQRASRPAPVALQGDIAAIAIENIFQLFDFAALTGKLEIQSPTNSGCFYFRNGVLIHGLLRINHRKIGQLLLDAGLISAAQLRECLRIHEQAGTSRRFGQLLLDKGYIEAELLDNTLLLQVKEAFFETLSWHEGTFRFYPDQMPAADACQLQARIDHLLLEGMVQIDQSALEA